MSDLLNYYLERISFTSFCFQGWECSTLVFYPQIQYFYFSSLIPSYRPIFLKSPIMQKINKMFLCWSIILDYLPHSSRTNSNPFLFDLFFMGFEWTFCGSLQFARCCSAVFTTSYFLLSSFRLLFIPNILYKIYNNVQYSVQYSAFLLWRHGASMCFPLVTSCKHHKVLYSA